MLAWAPGASSAEFTVNTFEDSCVVIQCLHDRQPDSADVFERFLSRGLTPSGIIPEVTQELLEALVRLSSFPAQLLIRTPAIGAHREAQVAQLFQNQLGAWVEIAHALPRHSLNLSPEETDFNMPCRR
jgi:hypothetical protein